MEYIDPSTFEDRSAKGLISFLSLCQQRAAETFQPWIASISLKVADLDALAVLDAIYEPGEKHFYLERSPQAVSGAEAVVEMAFQGSGRLGEADAWVKDWSKRILLTGDTDQDFFGPLFFGAFPFASDSAKSGFLFLPRWQVCRSGLGCSAVANTLIDGHTDIAAETGRILRAHQRLSRFEAGPTVPATPGEPTRFKEVSQPSPVSYQAGVQTALSEIASGEVEKLVLARWLELETALPILPLETLHRLREAFPDCFSFSTTDGSGASWIGASPERLVKVATGHFATEAIAGSRQRGASFGEDSALGRELLGSGKDLHEHQLVVDSIVRRIENDGIQVDPIPSPHLIKLANIQHLRTPIGGPCAGDTSSLHLAGLLHPTPAVGGVPRDEALSRIAAIEQFDREIYGGFVGWTSPHGDGEWVVAIRTARVEGQQARLFAGAGIVRGSDPAAEWQETEDKLRAVRRALEGST